MGKYYRFMKDIEHKENLSKLLNMKNYFRKGDYLEPHDGGRIFLHLRLKAQNLLADLHEDVEGFVSHDDFREFLSDGSLVEVPQNIRELDLEYQREICHLVAHCDRAYDSLCLAERWGEDVQIIEKRRKNYDILCHELDGVRDRQNDKVVKPLEELHELQQLFHEGDIGMLQYLKECCKEEDKVEVETLIYLNATVGIGWGEPSGPQYIKEFEEREDEYFERRDTLLEKYAPREFWEIEDRLIDVLADAAQRSEAMRAPEFSILVKASNEEEARKIADERFLKGDF